MTKASEVMARNEGQKDLVSKSLKAISVPNEIRTMKSATRGAAVAGLGLAALAAAMFTWLTWNRFGQTVRKQEERSKFYQTAQQAVLNARGKMGNAASSKVVENLRSQIHSTALALSTKLRELDNRQPKHEHTWFG